MQGLLRKSFTILLCLIFSSVAMQFDFKELREIMLEHQIKDRGITDVGVLDAMQKVERHKFVPADIAHLAYIDSPLSIGYGQTISQPYIVAYMTEILSLQSNDKVLEIGTGSGYQAAILAEICDTVFSIELVPQLADRSRKVLNELGYGNIKLKTGNGYLGWPSKAPFNAILVTCAPTHIPKPLQEQLAEGGKMIIPVGEKYVQELILIVKKNGKLKQQAVLPVRFVPMLDEKGKVY